MEIEAMSTQNDPASLIYEPNLVDHNEVIASIAKCANNLDISDLTQAQQTLVIQLVAQFTLTNQL